MIQPNISEPDTISLSPDLIEEFLADLARRGRTEGTLRTYRGHLKGLYNALPENKQLGYGGLPDVRDRMIESGAAPSTADLTISAANGLLRYCGRRELYQAPEEGPMVQPGMPMQRPVTLDLDLIEEFLADLSKRGRSEGTLRTYRHRLKSLYNALPEDKQIGANTLAEIQKQMLEEGISPSTTNLAISAANSLLEYCGRRELQLRGTLEGETISPELTRAEYLRILSIARTLEKERTYLLVKVFACLGLLVQELEFVTVEAVEAGQLEISRECIVHVPPCLRQELLDYARKSGILHGPIFITRVGCLMDRFNVSSSIRRLASDARVDPEKCTPRCLRKLYQETQKSLQADLERLLEQNYNHLLETEQLVIGWGEQAG